MVFIDGSKFNRFCLDGRVYNRQRIGNEFNENCSTSTDKRKRVYCDTGWVILNCYDPICRINGIMNYIAYIDILNMHLLSFANDNYGQQARVCACAKEKA